MLIHVHRIIIILYNACLTERGCGNNVIPTCYSQLLAAKKKNEYFLQKLNTINVNLADEGEVYAK